MFTRECLLRNVGEAKMHVIYELTKLGYSPMYMKFENNVGGSNVVCEGQTWHCTDSDNKPHCIDCGENIDLFLAIAALRDDSDYMQWFICTKTRTRRKSGYFGQIVGMDGHYQEIVGYEWHRHENNDNALTKKLNAMMQMECENMEFLPHKATVKELIKHFK